MAFSRISVAVLHPEAQQFRLAFGDLADLQLALEDVRGVGKVGPKSAKRRWHGGGIGGPRRLGVAEEAARATVFPVVLKGRRGEAGGHVLRRRGIRTQVVLRVEIVDLAAFLAAVFVEVIPGAGFAPFGNRPWRCPGRAADMRHRRTGRGR